MVELFSWKEDVPRFPIQHIGLAQNLCRLDSDLVFRLAHQLVHDPKDKSWCYQYSVDTKEHVLYIRWDNYVRYCRLAILLFLKTGHVRRFILHCCHISEEWESTKPDIYIPNRRAAFDEIQDVIDQLEHPELTEFFVDTVEGLHSYMTRSGGQLHQPTL